MSERELRGLAAAGGIAVGPALVVHDFEPPVETGGGTAEAERALDALAQVAADLGRTAGRLREAGLADEAEILEANRLMAEDPVLVGEVRARAADAPAAIAVRAATDRHAELLAALDDPLLAARAADVRQLGRRVQRLLSGVPVLVDPPPDAILVARDLGPADVADLDLASGHIAGIALAEGAATSHAAIMARSLGLPMAVGLGEEILGLRDGELVVVDGDRGLATLDPAEHTLRRRRAQVGRALDERRRLAGRRAFEPVTRDGRRVTLLCNASTTAEVAAGLEAGAEGVGLLRTELAFLEATSWPTEREHAAALAPVLAGLAGRVATVRTLDFGADKTPPFLAGIDTRGLALSLAHPDSLAAQLRAILRAGAETRIRIMLPLVQSPEEFRAARRLLDLCLTEVEWRGPRPALGAMVETPEAARRAADIALEADFLSIGTNDLVQYTLGLDRERPLATAQGAADPRVLRLVDETARAAHRAGLTVEVCGEAAGEPPLVALLVGLGIDELSVAPARLDGVRATVRLLTGHAAAERAQAALYAASADIALALADELLSGEPDDQAGEVVNGLDGVLA